jgi:activator of HSP90 ATPase
MPREIKHRLTFGVRPRELYAALMDEQQHAAITGAAARIAAQVGGRFSVQGGFVTGFNVELVVGKRIVQAWRGRNWPIGAWSIVTFELSRVGKERTRLTFTQYGVPDKFHTQIGDGWRVHYWEPLRKWLAREASTRRSRS